MLGIVDQSGQIEPNQLLVDGQRTAPQSDHLLQAKHCSHQLDHGQLAPDSQASLVNVLGQGGGHVAPPPSSSNSLSIVHQNQLIHPVLVGDQRVVQVCVFGPTNGHQVFQAAPGELKCTSVHVRSTGGN